MRNLFDRESFAAARLFASLSVLCALLTWPAWRYTDFGALTAFLIVWCWVASYVTQGGARNARRDYGKITRANRRILRDISRI
jgi:uncharacterized membrane protein YqjE